MARHHIRIGSGWRFSAAVVAGVALVAGGGCTKEDAGTPGSAKSGPAPTVPAATQPSADAASAAAAASAAGTTPAATEPGGNALFTLPPSKGPAPHQFQPVTLMRSGPSGDLEMQLTGDGIYRIRDHGRGKSYSGDGKLTDEQVAEWAAGMKDWESLKDKYIPDPPPADADTVEIIYGGKKVVASSAGKDTPKAFADAYQRLLGLNEQAKKEAAAAEAAVGKPAEPDKAAADKAAPASPAADGKAAAPADPAGNPQGVTPKQ
jgi:hypothetical protein